MHNNPRSYVFYQVIILIYHACYHNLLLSLVIITFILIRTKKKFKINLNFNYILNIYGSVLVPLPPVIFTPDFKYKAG